jgi:thymidylate synthase (FAD)
MKIIEPSVEIIDNLNGIELLRNIELAGRVCYKSEDKITEDAYKDFIRGIIKRGHESVIEHEKISVKFICDRGVTHEIVKHRIASYSQESMRYCNYFDEKYGSEITVIRPCFWDVQSQKFNLSRKGRG